MNCAVSIEPELCAGADELPEEEKVALEGLEQEIGVVDLCVWQQDNKEAVQVLDDARS